MLIVWNDFNGCKMEFLGKWSYYVMEKNLYQFVYKIWWQLYKLCRKKDEK